MTEFDYQMKLAFMIFVPEPDELAEPKPLPPGLHPSFYEGRPLPEFPDEPEEEDPAPECRCGTCYKGQYDCIGGRDD